VKEGASGSQGSTPSCSYSDAGSRNSRYHSQALIPRGGSIDSGMSGSVRCDAPSADSGRTTGFTGRAARGRRHRRAAVFGALPETGRGFL